MKEEGFGSGQENAGRGGDGLIKYHWAWRGIKNKGIGDY